MNILREAYALNPNSSHVLYASGWVHSYVGDQITAINHFNRSIRINPLDPMIGQIRCGLGAALLMSGRVGEGVETLEQALVEAPEYTASWLALAIGHWELGRVDEARRFGQKLLAREPGMTISGTIRDTPLTMPDMLDKIDRSLRGIGIPE